MNYIKNITLILLLFCTAQVAFAQDVTVTGNVKDASGEALIGVNVIVKGTTVGTITDLDGNYTLAVPNSDAILVFSYIGYLDDTEVVGSRRKINVTLKDDSQALEEVVVVGYGVQKKVTVTGAVASVQGEELKSSATSNLTNAMVGRMPGVIGMQGSDEPGGGGTTIRIRGTNSLGSKDPLVVIDGVPGRAGGMDRLNPNEIESMSVLKDAAAAIYGSRAANGVILITTKRGKEGKPKVSYQGLMGFSRPTRLPEMCNAFEYATLVNQIYDIRGDAAPYSAEDLALYQNGQDPWGHPSTNWFDETIKDVSPMYRHDIGLSGGSEKFKFYLNLAANGEDGIYKKSANRYDQYSIRANLDSKVNDFIDISYSMTARLEDRQYPTKSASSIFNALLRSKPDEPAYWPSGEPGPDIEYGDNPVVTGTDETGYDRQKSIYLQNTIKANVKIPWVEGLSVMGSATYDKYIKNRKRFNTPWILYNWDGNEEHKLTPASKGPAEPNLTLSNENQTDWMVNVVANWNRSFGKHNVGITAGVEAEDKYNDFFDAYRRYFISDVNDELDAGSVVEQNVHGNSWEEARMNYFGRFSYNYLERYLLEFVWRYDGSYRFPTDKRYGFFPGVSAAWRASEENFWKENITFIDYFKLRASVSQTGNDALTNSSGSYDRSIQYLNTYGFGTDYLFGNSFAKTLNPTRTPNPLITWEVGTTYNIGFDFKFLDNRLTWESDLFYHKRTNMLISRNASLPETSGITLPRENLGKMENKGFESLITWNDQVGEFQYGVSLNMTYAKNKILYWDETPGAPEWQKSTGHKANTNLYYQTDGVFNTEEELNSYPHWPGARLGDLKFIDYDKNGVIDADDRVRSSKNGEPDFVGGMTLTGAWKNFDFMVLFQGAVGGQTEIWIDRAGIAGNTYKFVYQNRWTKENPMVEHPYAHNRDDEYWLPPVNPNDYWLRNTNYLRLKNLEVGYTFDNFEAIRNAGISGFRVFVNATNLLTFDYVKVRDPEGTDREGDNYPQRTTANFGVSITF